MTASVRTARPAIAGAALACVAALAAACGSSTPNATPTKTVTASPGQGGTASGSGTATTGPAGASPGGPAPCPTRSLGLKLGPSQGAAGSTYVALQFTNNSSVSCTLYGYPGVSLGAGQPVSQVGLAADRNPAPPRELVTLAPGAVASALLRIVDALAASWNWRPKGKGKAVIAILANDGPLNVVRETVPAEWPTRRTVVHAGSRASRPSAGPVDGDGCNRRRSAVD